jgi:hypothetical protein
MRRFNEVISGYITRYTFEIAFALVFVMYLLFLSFLTETGSGGLLAFCLVLPIGFLLYVVALPGGEVGINWLLALPIGFVLGWLARKLLMRGTSGRIILVALLLLNSIAFWSWFWTNADLGP